jgi:molybdopterin biosynthesis enzyme
VNPGALSWERARAVAGRTEPMAPVAARLEQAVGTVLAGDVRAPAGLPAAVTAAMDGFAVSGRGRGG